MPIPIRVINLRRSAERRVMITAHLATLGLVPRFFDAVDGSRMTAAEVAAMRPGRNPRYGTPLKLGEIGVGASYRALCDEIAAGVDPYVCILEDDAIFDPAAAKLLDPSFLSSLPPFDVLRFGHGGTTLMDLCITIAATDTFAVTAPIFPAGMTLAQVVTPEGARRIAAGLVPLHTAVDTLLFNDGYIRGLRVLHIVPNLARHAGATPSNVDNVSDWPQVSFWGRFSAKAAQSAAILRIVANFVQAWGFAALIRAMLKR